MAAAFAFDVERLVIALREQLRMQSPQLEQLAGDEQLLAAIPPIGREVRGRRTANIVQQSSPRTPIDWPAIVGIDKTEIPQFSALIYVRHTRHCQLED
jgi:hypothetical protein